MNSKREFFCQRVFLNLKMRTIRNHVTVCAGGKSEQMHQFFYFVGNQHPMNSFFFVKKVHKCGQSITTEHCAMAGNREKCASFDFCKQTTPSQVKNEFCGDRQTKNNQLGGGNHQFQPSIMDMEPSIGPGQHSR